MDECLNELDVLEYATQILESIDSHNNCVSDSYGINIADDNGIEEIDNLKNYAPLDNEECSKLIIDNRGLLSLVMDKISLSSNKQKNPVAETCDAELSDNKMNLWNTKEHALFHLLVNTFGLDMKRLLRYFPNKRISMLRRKYNADIKNNFNLLEQGTKQPLFETYNEDEVNLLVDHFEKAYLLGIEDGTENISQFTNECGANETNKKLIVDDDIRIPSMKFIDLLNENNSLKGLDICDNLMNLFKKLVLEDVDQIPTFHRLIEYLNVDIEAEIMYTFKYALLTHIDDKSDNASRTCFSDVRETLNTDKNEYVDDVRDISDHNYSSITSMNYIVPVDDEKLHFKTPNSLACRLVRKKTTSNVQHCEDDNDCCKEAEVSEDKSPSTPVREPKKIRKKKSYLGKCMLRNDC